MVAKLRIQNDWNFNLFGAQKSGCINEVTIRRGSSVWHKIMINFIRKKCDVMF